MRPIQLVILLVALGAAGGAGLLAMKIGTTPPPQPVAAAPVPSIETEQVLVAAKDIGIGASILPDTVGWKDWPKSGMSNGYILRSAQPDAVTDLKGMLARGPIMSGEPVRLAKLVRSDRGFLSAVLPQGMRAVAVRVNAASTAGGFILPEDRVDIMLVQDKEGSTAVAETILTNVRILAIDQNVEQSGEQKGAMVAQNTATLELTPEQAEMIVQAQQVGSISLSLRPLVEANTPTEKQARPTGIAVVKYGVVSRVTAQQAK
jgi:pilus assembly protein CpaB